MPEEDQKKEIELLINRMSGRTPILVIGAGFSCGVINGQGRQLPSGKELANELTDVLLTKLPKSSLQYLDEYRQDQDNLKKTCDNIREEQLIKERNDYITQRMKGCHCDAEDYHMLLKCHPWKHIFSLNVDDFIEYLYQSPSSQSYLNIHVGRQSPIVEGTTCDLYKLHGSVSHASLGYVFDSQEYREHMVSDSWALTMFGHLFLTNDVIFLGTEFQEDDLLLMIEKYTKMVNIEESFHYFFVSPGIHSRSLRRTIENTSYMHHIPWDTQKFLTHLKTEITDVEELRRKMRDYGMVFYDEKQQDAITNPRYDSDLYLGNPPRPVDFFQSYDIVRPTLNKKAKAVSESGKNQLIIFHGKPYVGKTCAALRLGVDLMAYGYDFCVFNLPITMDAKTYERLLLEYLSKLPKGKKVAILAENMADFYSHIKSVLENCPPQIESFIFICTTYSASHESKKYLLDEYKTPEEILITEKTRDGRTAQAIYDKLAEKSHLNKLRSYGDTEKECVQYIRSVNDIIDVLYIAQEGRGFVDHFSEWVNKQAAGAEQDAFFFLNILFRLGIPSISKVVFSRLLVHCGIKVDLRDFLSHYSDIVQISDNNLSLRCSRLLWDSIKEKIEKEVIVSYLTKSASYIAGSLRENDETINNIIFQKLIKTNSLYRQLNLSKRRIADMLLKLERICKGLSYYWVQRGIADREIERFEEASNALSEAAAIRNKSFHIKHAQAKNYMQWGLWACENQPGRATDLFEHGKEQMSFLIADAPSRYYPYSVHTYVDMTLRFHQKSGIPVDFDELADLLQKLLAEHNDKLNPQIAKEFIDFCYMQHRDSRAINDLRTLYHSKYNHTHSIDYTMDYTFDSDDLAD